MEEITAYRLRSEIRKLYQEMELKGFVRFMRQGSALFVSDVSQREDMEQLKKLCECLENRKFDWRLQEGLLQITPMAVRIRQEADRVFCRGIQTHEGLPARLMAHPPQPLTQSGVDLAVEALRGQFSPPGKRKNLKLRQMIAESLRKRDLSGLYESGIFLSEIGKS